MSRHSLAPLLRRLREQTASAGLGEVGDAALLERFLHGHDEAAFEVLVRRHGRMVFGVCRRLLRCAHDAEDAFQATFLALVRKGGSIRCQQSLTGWLYRVAYRIALRARTAAVRRGVVADGSDVAAPDDAEAVAWRELGPLLDEEVHRLPEKPRAAVVLCYLGGRSTAAAAAELGVPRGTVLSRLAWARQRLRSRLLQRGVAPALAGVTAALVVTALEAAPLEWVRKAVQVASGTVSARVVALMEGVFRAMMLARLKVAGAMLALVALVGVGLLRWALTPADAVAQDVRRDPLSGNRRDEGPKTASRPPTDGDKADAPPSAGIGRPLGTWERQLGPMQYVVRFETDHVFFFMMDMTVENQRLKFEAEADYSVTKDSVLYGVITSIDVPGTDLGKGKDEELAKMLVKTSSLMDHPFSIRYRVDDNVLTIKDVNVGGLGGLADGDRGENTPKEMKWFVLGRYKKKTSTDPNPLRR